MPAREEHLRSVERFEAFLQQISTSAYREWIVVVWFYIALHYVDAVLAEKKGHLQITDHSDRGAKMVNCDETRAILETYQDLYDDSKEARYECGEFAPLDLEPIRRRYEVVRRAMRAALGLRQ